MSVTVTPPQVQVITVSSPSAAPGGVAPVIVVDPTRGGAVGPPGPSAYDTAVAHGFVGTESDWLLSLRAGMGYWTLQADSGTTFPSRSTVPAWWTGPVLYDSTAYANHTDPADPRPGDHHLKRSA